MRSAILGFVVGAAWLQTQAGLPSMHIALALSCCAALMLALLAFQPKLIAIATPLRCIGLALVGALAGFAWAAIVAHIYLREELPREWEGRDITLIGTVDSLPHRFERGVRFDFAVEKALPSAADAPADASADVPVVPSKLALSWYVGFHGEDLQSVPDLQPGERWQLTVRLRRPHGNANPHGFDYEVWLLEQGLRATGYVRPDRRLAHKNERLTEFVPGFSNTVERLRSRLRERILRALPEHEYAGVIVALVIGDQRAIGQSDWQVFNRTGVGHLISISGLHITMVAGMFAGLFQFLWRRSFFTRARLPLLLPAQKAAALAGAAMALLYVLLAGFGVPAQRTLYMLSVVAIALWFDRLASVSYVLCVALLVVVVFDPWAVLWPGFWLSFGAVAIILYTSVGRATAAPASIAQSWFAGLRTASLTQYAVTLGLVPLTMLLFGQISIVSPVANAIAIPLISFIVTPLALLGSVLPSFLSSYALQFAHWCTAQLAHVLAWLSALPVSVWSAPIPDGWIFATALIGTLWLLAPRGWPHRWIGMTGWLPLLFNTPAYPPAGQLWLTAFDVGQGSAILIETANKRLLYDTGPAYSTESDGGSRVILPYLKARGIDRLDGVIVSHSDNDHAGGALSLLSELRVDWLSSSMDQTHPIVQAAANHRRCEAGQSWTWDGVQFEMLHPSVASYDIAHWKPNARSCTLKIFHQENAILLPGDIERKQEAELLENFASRLKSTVLVAPHHGSGTSSTQAFLDAVDPELALFQVGYRNRYRHPKQEVYDRYAKMGVRRLRSDDAGAITLRFEPALTYSEYRVDHARYWYGK